MVKISDIKRAEFLNMFYAFLMENDYNFEIGDSFELLEKFIANFEFEGD